jgi:hypothetical protein
MNLETNVSVVGLKEAMKELNSFDKVARRQVTKDFKQITQPVVNTAKGRIPFGPPLSGMARSWTPSGRRAPLLPWNPMGDIRQVINTKKVKEYQGTKVNLAVFSVKWVDAVAQIFDFASNGRLGQSLTSKFGTPSRVMWKTMDSEEDRVMAEMLEMIGRVMDDVNKRLVRGD